MTAPEQNPRPAPSREPANKMLFGFLPKRMYLSWPEEKRREFMRRIESRRKQP